MNVKPTKLKVLEGNLGKRPLPTNEPAPAMQQPKMPAELKLDAAAARTWKTLAPKLVKLGLLTEIDGDSFSDLCQIRARIIAIRKYINAHNRSLMEVKKTIDPFSGKEAEEIRPSAYVKLELAFYDLFRKKAHEFGLCPRGRTGLSVGGSGKKSAFEQLLD